jgi:MFS family permease
MTALATDVARREWREGWPLAIAALAGMGIGSIAIYVLGALVAPLEAEFGWSRTEIMLGLTIATLCGAALAPIVGLMLDRWGPRRIALPGAVILLFAFSALSLTTDNVAVWFGLWVLLSFGSVGVKPTVWAMAIAATFEKARGLAMAVALCGSSIAALTMPILATWLIDTQGWRNALPMIAAIVGAVVLPILFFGLHSKADRPRSGKVAGADGPTAAPLQGSSVRDALLSPQFAKLAGAAFIFTAFAIGLVSNMIPVITSMGFTRAQSAGIAGLVGVASFTGRLLTGYLIDRFSSDLIAGSCVALPAISCAMLLVADGNIAIVVTAILILGLSLGAEVDLIAYLTAEKFGTARYGTIFGFMTSSWYLATAAGPVLISLVYDLSGNYDLAIKLAIPAFAITALLLFTLGKPLPFAEPAPA